ncbi:MAG TPA: phospho-N-acetylmuramoyl-pentapeptide-transferase [Dehalococcoidia bacterium]|nr:phospho-N-acetylmuramoyl-pentapeptide-transferase [Dehalococcoidia bacterium]
MAYALAVGGFAFVIALICGDPIVRLLRRRKIGKQIRLEGPQSHFVKEGTPTMGGLIIFIAIAAATVPFNLADRLSIMLPLFVVIGCGLLGGIDDLMNLSGGRLRGLSARFKMLWLLLIALIAALALHFLYGLSTAYVPFVGKVELGWLYVPIAIVCIAGMANAVNITDGLDTLAGGTSACAFAAYGVIAYLQGQAYLVTFCFTVVGALLGFLWFNAHPARVFMGDIGSLALGASLSTVAFMTGQWLLLALIGIVFIAELASVMIQVSYFKLSGGRRIFRMSPLHHHFEQIGWAETQVALRFWLVAMMAGMLGVALALV